MQKRHFVKLRVFPILLSFLSVFFILTIQVNAEDVNHYPYVISSQNEIYNTFGVNNADLINYFLSDPDISNAIQGNDYLLYFDDVVTWFGAVNVNVIVNPIVTQPINYSSDFTSTGFYVNGWHYKLMISYSNGGYHIDGRYSATESSNTLLFGNTNLITVSGISGFNDGVYKQNYPFFSTIPLYNGLNSDEILVVVSSGNDNPLSSIVFVPSADLGAYIGASVNLPYPRPSISQWDNNLSGFENVYHILGDLADTMEWGYVSLIDNIFSAIDNLGSQVRDWSAGIQTTINNGFVFLSNNLEEFFTPFYEAILDKLNTITDVVAWFKEHGLDNDGNFELVVLLDYLFNADPDEFSDLFENSTLGFLFSAVTNILEAVYFFIYSWFTITPTKVLHIPSCEFLGQEIGDFYVDFSWYDDYKTLGDGIISFFLVCGYAVWFVTRMVGFFRGTAPEVKEGLTVAHK